MRNRPAQTSESPLASLSRTLESLEARLSRIPGRTAEPAPPRARPRVMAEAVSEIVMRRRMLDAIGGEAPTTGRGVLPSPARRRQAEPDGFAASVDPAAAASSLMRRVQALAAEARTLNGDDAGLRLMSEIAGELQKLRDEVQNGAAQASFEKGFADLRASFEELRRMIGERESADAIERELQTISAALAQLTEAGADRAVLNTMRSELEELRHLFREDAREAAFHASRQHRPSFGAAHGGRVEADVAARTELKNELERLRDSLRSLAGEDQTSADNRQADMSGTRQGTANGGDAVSVAIRDELGALRARLETLADASPLKIAEARWAELEKRLDDRQVEAGVQALAERLGEIETHLAALPGSVDVSMLEERLRTLAEGVDALARRTEQADMQNFLSLEERLDEISRAIVATATPPVLDMAPIERLEARIAALTGRVDQMNDDGDMEKLAERIAELSDRVEDLSANPPGAAVAQRMQALADRFELALADFEAPQPVADTSAIEERIDRMAERFDLVLAGMEAPKLDTAAIEQRLASLAVKLEASLTEARVDATLVRSLETQIERLSNSVTRVGTSQEAFETDIDTRLGAIERRLDDHRDALIEAAREIAEETARRMQAAGDRRQAEHVARLSENLKALEALARNNDGQSNAVFDAVHTTLLKVVDRLERMEDDLAGGKREAVARYGNDDRFERYEPAPRTSMAAPSPSPSLVARPRDEVAAPAVDASEVIDRSEMNRPLEPGSGMPDIGALLERVRAAQRSRTEAAPEPVEESETRAAARKAAKAASAEAATLRTAGAANEEQGGFKALLARRRKAILTGVVAVIVALSALPIGNAVMGHRGARDASEPVVAAVAPPITVDPQPVRDTPTSVSPAVTEPAAPEPDVVLPPQPVPPPVPAQAEPTSVPEPSPASPAVAAATAGPELLAKALAELPASAATRPSIPAGVGPAPLMQAAEADDPRAAFEIGLRLLEGRAGEPQPAAALDWFAHAARQGYVPAQYSLGTLFEKGNGVSRNTAAARDWYTLAAENGNIRAMHNLAVLYATGIDGRSQPDVAAKWFTQAADHGMRDSQYNLGILYARGSGVSQDLAASYKWFGVVAEAGDSDAAAKRDEIGKSLPADQLRAAQDAVKAFAPAPRVELANTVDTPPEWQDTRDQTSSVDMTKAIRNIQAILGRLGYDVGAPDGKLGDRTRLAITAFQKANDLTATGEIDGPLIRALLQKKDTKTGA